MAESGRQRVLILGCGYLGYNLATSFYQDYDVSIIGLPNEYSQRLVASYSNDEINYEDIDLSEPARLDAILRPDTTVINAIGSTNATAAVEDVVSDLFFYKLVANLLLYLNTRQVRKFIQISSGGTVYGNPEQQPISETTPSNPLNIYALQKVFIEELLKINYLDNGSLPYSILRVSNPYGGFQIKAKQQGVIPIFIRSILKGEELTLWVDIETVRDFIYITDFAAGIELAMHKAKNESIYNLGSGVGLSLKQLIHTISKGLDRSPVVHQLSKRTNLIPTNVLDISRIRDLGFQLEVSIQDGIQREIERILQEEEVNYG